MHSIPLTPEEVKRRKAEREALKKRLKRQAKLLKTLGFERSSDPGSPVWYLGDSQFDCMHLADTIPGIVADVYAAGLMRGKQRAQAQIKAALNP